jgi:pimeloyl-ACP methyl ester carboxylesterase
MGTDHLVRLPGGTRLSYRELGSTTGRAVLFLHGTPSSRLEADGRLGEVAETLGLRVLAPDRPGYGRTPFVGYDVRGNAEHLVGLLDVLEISEVGIVGVSGAGPYACACAAHLGHRVARAALVASTAPSDLAAVRATWIKGDRQLYVLAVRAPSLLRTYLAAVARRIRSDPQAGTRAVQRPARRRRSGAGARGGPADPRGHHDRGVPSGRPVCRARHRPRSAPLGRRPRSHPDACRGLARSRRHPGPSRARKGPCPRQPHRDRSTATRGRPHLPPRQPHRGDPRLTNTAGSSCQITPVPTRSLIAVTPGRAARLVSRSRSAQPQLRGCRWGRGRSRRSRSSLVGGRTVTGSSGRPFARHPAPGPSAARHRGPRTRRRARGRRRSPAPRCWGTVRRGTGRLRPRPAAPPTR